MPNCPSSTKTKDHRTCKNCKHKNLTPYVDGIKLCDGCYNYKLWECKEDHNYEYLGKRCKECIFGTLDLNEAPCEECFASGMKEPLVPIKPKDPINTWECPLCNKKFTGIDKRNLRAADSTERRVICKDCLDQKEKEGPPVWGHIDMQYNPSLGYSQDGVYWTKELDYNPSLNEGLKQLVKEQDETMEDRVKRLEDTINLWGSIFHDDIEKRVTRLERVKKKQLKKQKRIQLRDKIRELKGKKPINPYSPICWYAILSFLLIISLLGVIPITITLINHGIIPIWVGLLWCLIQLILGTGGIAYKIIDL